MYARRRRRYFTMMAICLVLFVSAWAFVRLWSVPAAIAMCVVAMVIPPFAAITANKREADDRWWDEPRDDARDGAGDRAAGDGRDSGPGTGGEGVPGDGSRRGPDGRRPRGRRPRGR